MKNKLKVGQSFEVVEWLGCKLQSNPDYEKEEIGFQSIKDEIIDDTDFYMFSSKGIIHASISETKPIGKLTITKLK